MKRKDFRNSAEINKTHPVNSCKKQHNADRWLLWQAFYRNRIILTKITGFFAEKYKK